MASILTGHITHLACLGCYVSAYTTACSSSCQYPATSHSHWRGVDRSWLVEWNSHPHPECSISHRLARICSEQCLENCITSTSYVCLPLYNVLFIVFLNCKSLWIKASAKWINVNVAYCKVLPIHYKIVFDTHKMRCQTETLSHYLISYMKKLLNDTSFCLTSPFVSHIDKKTK